MSRVRKKRGKNGRTKRDRCRIDGEKLRRLRTEAELTIRELAYAVGVDPKTITDLEAGRRLWNTVRVARNIAAHPQLDVEWTKILVDEKKSAKRRPLPVEPPRSSLDVFVAEEHRVGRAPHIDAAEGPVPPFGAIELVNVFSSPASLAGIRFYARGSVKSQRGLSVTDGVILGIDHQNGARFEIAQPVGDLEEPLTFTVTTIDLAHTRMLQWVWEYRHQATITLRVLTATAIPADGDHVRVTNLEWGGEPHVRMRRSGDELWRGFYQIEPKPSAGAPARPPKPHPWALIVESIGE